jgi:hypothetical protein
MTSSRSESRARSCDRGRAPANGAFLFDLRAAAPGPMPSFGSYDAYITVDGVKLAEYAVDIQADTADGVPVVSCWIPSESGKARLTTHPPQRTPSAYAGTSPLLSVP